MPAGLHGSAEITVTIDDAPGGTPRIITPHVRSIGGLAIELLTQQTNPFGTTYESHTPTGVERTPDIAIGGFFNDTALVGPHIVLKPGAADKAVQSVGRVLVIVTGGGTFTITVHLVRYEVIAKAGELTEYAALVRQKSAGVWS
jgi:hypothetical protein